LICGSNRAGRELDPYGLSPTLYDSNMLEHTHQFAEPEDFDVMFLYFHQHAINFCSLMLFSSCCIRVAL